MDSIAERYIVSKEVSKRLRSGNYEFLGSKPTAIEAGMKTRSAVHDLVAHEHKLSGIVRYERRRDRSDLALREVAAVFDALANEWDRETMLLSSVTSIVMNESYQRIIGMGPLVLPLILRRLQTQGGHWFWALRCIAREDPVPLELAGSYDQMRQSWLNWGAVRGLL